MAASNAQGLSPERPFPGLRPFAFEDHDYFFGRKSQFYALYRLIDVNRFAAVVGSSGSGKSSLVRAGLLPLLRQESNEAGARKWLWQEMRPGDGPVAQLGDALIRLARSVSNDDDSIVQEARNERIRRHLADSSFGIEGALSEIGNLERVSFVLVVDQFEELFRFVVNARQEPDQYQQGSKRNEATRFVQSLLAASRSKSHDIRVIITIRSDFIGDCARFQGLPEAVSAAQFLVPSLTRDQREQVIRGPIRTANATIDSTVVERILIESNDELDQLPVMAHCLRRLWDRAGLPVSEPHLTSAENGPDQTRKPATGRHIALEHYEAIGGVSGTLSLHANEIVRSLPGLELAIEQAFRALSELDREGRATRRARLLEQLLAETGVPEADLHKVLDCFRDENCSFLTPPFSAQPVLTLQSRIDVGHEALLRRWETVSGDPGATGAATDPRRLGWLQDEARDGRQYQALLSLVENRSHATLPLDQVERYWEWWTKPTGQPRTEAWAERYGGGYARIQRLMDDSRAALEADRKRQKLEAERERQHIVAERRTNRRFRVAFVVSFALLLLSVVSGFMLNNQYITSQKNAEEAEHNLDLALNQTRKMTLAVQEALRQGSVSVTAAKDILTSAEDHELKVTMGTPKGKSVQALVYILTSEVEATLGYRSIALVLAKKAAALAQELVAENPSHENRKLLLDSLVKVGNAELTTGLVQASLDDYTKARDIARELKDISQADGQSLYSLLSVEVRLSEALRLLGRYSEARDVLDEALAFAEQCAKMQGANLQWRISPAVIQTKIGIVWAEQREPNDDVAQKDRHRHARDNFDKAIKGQQALRISVDDILGNGDIAKYNLAKSYIAKANLLAALGQYKSAISNDLGEEDGDFAIPIYKRSLSILERLFDKDPANVNWLIELAIVSGNYGSALQKVNDLKGALAQYVSETFYYKKIIAKNDTNAEWNARLSKSESLVSELRKQLGSPDVPQDANETGKPK